MTYTIGEVAEQLDLSVPTLRYYDREGLTPYIERTDNGTRIFKDLDVALLNVIQCLKSSGMAIKDIKTFIEWCDEGDSSLQERHDLFMKRKEAVEQQMKDLQETMAVIDHKCEYYKTALAAGTEDVHKNDKIGTGVFD